MRENESLGRRGWLVRREGRRERDKKAKLEGVKILVREIEKREEGQRENRRQRRRGGTREVQMKTVMAEKKGREGNNR